jgi:hypothetical protein
LLLELGAAAAAAERAVVVLAIAEGGVDADVLVDLDC